MMSSTHRHLRRLADRRRRRHRRLGLSRRRRRPHRSRHRLRRRYCCFCYTLEIAGAF